MPGLLGRADDNSSCTSRNSSMPGQGYANEDDNNDEDDIFDPKVADVNIEEMMKNKKYKNEGGC